MSVEATPYEKTAPGELELVQAFVNSLDMERGDDELATPEALRDWLAARGLLEPDAGVSDGDLRRAIDAREGLRAVLRSHNGLPLDADALGRLDGVASRAGVRVRFDAEGRATLAPDAGGVDGALAHILSIVERAECDGTWDRMKACPKDDCEYAFYDKTKNRSGRWCSMETCGNVTKAKHYRERRKSDR
jgi:predicted RNA-binding Zn ribbon-like protein